MRIRHDSTRKIAKNRTQMQKSTIELQAQALMDWTRFEVEAQEIRLEAQALRIRLEAQASTNYPRIRKSKRKNRTRTASATLGIGLKAQGIGLEAQGTGLEACEAQLRSLHFRATVLNHPMILWPTLLIHVCHVGLQQSQLG